MTDNRAAIAEALRLLDNIRVATSELETLMKARDLLAALLRPDPEADWPDNVDGDLR